MEAYITSKRLWVFGQRLWISKILFLITVSSFLFSGNLGNEAIVVTKSDEVFAIGSNAAGCLGLGDLQSTLMPKKVEALCGKGVKGMMC